MECPWCGEQVGPEAQTCPNCGSRLRRASPVHCPYCRTEIGHDLTLCPHCGREQRQRRPWRLIVGATLGAVSIAVALVFLILPPLLRSLQMPALITPTSAAPPSPAASPVLPAPTPMPPTFTPTLTPTPATPTPTIAHTSTPSYTPTAPASSTYTPAPPSPSATPTVKIPPPAPTPPMPTPTPIGAFKYPRPELWGPLDRQEFRGRDAQIDLTWSPVPTGVLAEGEWYGLSVRFTGVDGQIVYGASRWLNEPQWRFPPEYYDQIKLSERSVWWDVRVVRESRDPDGSAGGIDISPISETRIFFWR